jgi:anaerobic selenocysteine-containing dehydrogenase
MLDDVRGLRSAPTAHTSPEFPMVLSAGERRAYTANDILRDPTWRKRDVDGALRISPADAGAIGLSDGGRARITTAAGTAEATVEISDAMLDGHVSLPNGYGVDYVEADGSRTTPGVAPNALTSTQWRDAYAGTPWHKHVPARIEAVASPSGVR